MTENIFFKVKSSKQSNPEARSTLDALHNQKMETLTGEKDKIGEYRQEITVLEEKIKKTTADTEVWKFEQRIEFLKKRIQHLENNDDIMDYYLRNGSILFDYYDVQDKIP